MQLVIFLPTFNVSCMRLKIRYDGWKRKYFGYAWQVNAACAIEAFIHAGLFSCRLSILCRASFPLAVHIREYKQFSFSRAARLPSPNTQPVDNFHFPNNREACCGLMWSAHHPDQDTTAAAAANVRERSASDVHSSACWRTVETGKTSRGKVRGVVGFYCPSTDADAGASHRLGLPARCGGRPHLSARLDWGLVGLVEKPAGFGWFNSILWERISWNKLKQAETWLAEQGLDQVGIYSWTHRLWTLAICALSLSSLLIVQYKTRQQAQRLLIVQLTILSVLEGPKTTSRTEDEWEP
jgi:hypothetical protein